MPINFKFYSWFSASDSVWKDGTYIYSENINTLNPEFIQISPKKQTLISEKDRIDYLVLNPFPYRSKDEFAYVERYKVWSSKWNLIYDHIADNGVTNLSVYNKNEPIKDPVYSWLVIAISSHWWVNNLVLYWPWVSTDKQFISPWFFYFISKSMPMYRFVEHHLHTSYVFDFIESAYERILIANSKLVEYDFWNWKVQNSGGFSAISITPNSNWYKVYSSNGLLNFVSNSGKNFWEIVEKYPLDINIFATKAYSGIEYIFAKQWLFFLNWIVSSPMWYKNKSNYLEFEKFNFKENLKWWFKRNDKFVFSVTKTSSWFDLNVLWSIAVWSPINFSSIVSLPYEDITSMIEYKDGILVSYKDKNWKFWIDYFSFENELSDEPWYLITKEYVADWQIFLKKADKLKFFADKLKDWEYLKISASINNGEFEEIKTLTKDDRWKNGFYEILNFNREFHKIVFKLELKWTFKLYDFLFYDVKIK